MKRTNYRRYLKYLWLVMIYILLIGTTWMGGCRSSKPVEIQAPAPITSFSSNVTGIPAHPVAGDSGVTAVSGSAADIQAAANTVYAAGGGTVYIPAGDFNLGGNVLIRDNISLIGAGLDKTILRTVGSYLWIKAQGNNIRISGFSLINTNNDGNIYGYDGIVINNCVDFRVDHLYIEGYAEAGVEVHGIDTRGVVDHCEIKVNVIGDEGYGVAVYRDDFWEGDIKLGSAEATFIEDCVFENCRHAVMAYSGGHYVFRHNLVKQGVVGHQVDAHGGKDSTTRGARAIEVYENVIEDPVSGIETACFIRGGGGVIFNNTIRGYRYSIEFTIEQAQIGQPYPILDQVHDFWVWNNPHDGSRIEAVVTDWSVDQIQENRDYFRYAKPGYTPYPYPHPLVLSKFK